MPAEPPTSAAVGAGERTAAGSGRSTLTPLHPCDLLKQLLPRLTRWIASVCWRRGVFREDAEDVQQEVLAKLADDDCSALERLRRQSNVRTFVWTITTNVILDEIRRRKSRWRPSAIARGLGTTAVMLEALLFRDGWEYDEAVAKLVAEGVRESLEELDAIRAKLPDRPTRRFVSDEAVSGSVAPEGTDDSFQNRDREELLTRLQKVLTTALGELDPEDRFLLKRLLFSGRTVAQVALELRVEQRPLYRRRDRILRFLRKRLESCSLGWNEIRELMGWRELDLGLG